MKTERGIYHNIKLSEYSFTIGDMQFFFSSKFYLSKFMGTYQQEKERFNRSLNQVYKDKFFIVGDYLSWIRLYCLIEKRGFYLKYKGVDIDCLDDLIFVVTPTYKTKFDELTSLYKTNNLD